MITPHFAVSQNNGLNIPRIMSLSLLDSKERPLASELVPFAKSYDVRAREIWSILLLYRFTGFSQISGGSSQCPGCVSETYSPRNSEIVDRSRVPLQKTQRDNVLGWTSCCTRIIGDLDVMCG